MSSRPAKHAHVWQWHEQLESVERDRWEYLWAQSERLNPFLSPRFLLPWARHFLSGRPLRIACWTGPDGANGLLFFYHNGAGWELLGGQEVADRLDALVTPGHEEVFWREFAKESRATGSVFPNVVEGSPLLKAAQKQGWSVTQSDTSPFVLLPARLSDYLAALAKKQRHELLRKERKALRAVPDLEYQTSDAAHDLPRFMRLHRLSHPDKSKFMTLAMESFFLDLSSELEKSGELRLGFLRVKGQDVAAMFQIESGGISHLYNSGFDPAFAELSPGLILLYRCIADAIRRGLREYDFLRGGERYKYDLGGTGRGVFRVVAP